MATRRSPVVAEVGLVMVTALELRTVAEVDVAGKEMAIDYRQTPT
jgi:hypothetical protein